MAHGTSKRQRCVIGIIRFAAVGKMNALTAGTALINRELDK